MPRRSCRIVSVSQKPRPIGAYATSERRIPRERAPKTAPHKPRLKSRTARHQAKNSTCRTRATPDRDAGVRTNLTDRSSETCYAGFGNPGTQGACWRVPNSRSSSTAVGRTSAANQMGELPAMSATERASGRWVQRLVRRSQSDSGLACAFEQIPCR